jgi:hypothetical protein
MKDQPLSLATIGYEGALLDHFIATLKSSSVRLLIDVRELPISRRKGFGKTALSTALEATNIGYLHLKGLGDPKPGREAARAGDYARFLKVFRAHMLTSAAQVRPRDRRNPGRVGRGLPDVLRTRPRSMPPDTGCGSDPCYSPGPNPSYRGEKQA